MSDTAKISINGIDWIEVENHNGNITIPPVMSIPAGSTLRVVIQGQAAPFYSVQYSYTWPEPDLMPEGWLDLLSDDE